MFISIPTAETKFAVIDIDETFDSYLEKDEDAVDVPLEQSAALVQRLDVAAGTFSEIKVESVTYINIDGVAETYSFKNILERQKMGVINDKDVYNPVR